MIIDYLLNIFYSQIADTEIQWHSWIDIYMLNRFFAFLLFSFLMAGMVISWFDAYRIMTLSGFLPQNWCGDVHTVKEFRISGEICIYSMALKEQLLCIEYPVSMNVFPLIYVPYKHNWIDFKSTPTGDLAQATWLWNEERQGVFRAKPVTILVLCYSRFKMLGCSLNVTY